jgi:hypothetical protein
MLGCILVDQPAVARHVHQQNPARAASERIAHGNELATPALERAEVARQRFGERPRRPRIGMAFGDRGRRAAQACEIKLVQQRGIERD